MKNTFVHGMMFILCLLSPVILFAQEESSAEEADGAEQAISGTVDQATREISDAAGRIAQGDVAAMVPLLERYVVPVISSLLILIVAYFVAKMVARLVKTPVQARVDETLGAFAGKMVFYAIMIFALLGVLGKFGVNVASFAAVIAAAGFAIGLAFQGSLSNLASGVLLLVFRPYKVGDVINAAGITAKVNEIDLFTTVFDTPDNRRIIVPNSAIAGGTIENITHHSERRVDVAVGVDYSADLDKTREILSSAAESLNEYSVEGEGRGYQIVLGDLGDSAVNWTVRFWAKAGDFWSVKEALTHAVKTHLDDAGIGIPFPQMDVHLVKDE
jgi:small conductance mechanosensitive channel